MVSLLSSKEGAFNPFETLLWGDITFKTDSVIIGIKIPKSRNAQGEYVDLFHLKNNSYCPVQALRALKKSKGDSYSLTEPVFKFKSGQLLTSTKLNATLRTLLVPHIGEAAHLISGHSFRAALPSALANRPDLANDEEIKLWGRWTGAAFKKYTRLKPDQKRAIFGKIVSSLESL